MQTYDDIPFVTVKSCDLLFSLLIEPSYNKNILIFSLQSDIQSPNSSVDLGQDRHEDVTGFYFIYLVFLVSCFRALFQIDP